MYKKLAGMTGTAETEAAEFDRLTSWRLSSSPPNMPMRRKEFQDVVYRTAKEKYFAVADEILRLNEEKQPVWWAHVDREERAVVADTAAQGIKHVVLNAKYHEREPRSWPRPDASAWWTIAPYGGPRHGYSAGWQRRVCDQAGPVKRGQARSVSAAEGAISPTAGPGMMRFYYQGQESRPRRRTGTRVASARRNTRANTKSVDDGRPLHSGTERHESRRIDISFAAAPDARAIPAHRVFICHSR